MAFFFLSAFIFSIGFLIGKHSVKSRPQSSFQVSQLNQLQSIYDIANQQIEKNKKITTETKTVLLAIQYLTSTQMTIESALDAARNYVKTLNSTPSNNESQYAATVGQKSLDGLVYTQQNQSAPQKTSIDTTSQLLYFGAFLLITAIGLFVAFAEVQGGLKVFLVSLLAVILYFGGDLLYNQTKSLKSVGTTFISVALITIPFIGIATHVYLLDQQHPAIVWLVTSITSFSVYLLSLSRYQQAFTGYLLMGSIISSLMSIVGVFELPVQTFYWIMIATGLLLKLIAYRYNSNKLINQPADQLSNIVVPLAIIASLLDVTSFGSNNASVVLNNTGQFAVTLLLTTFYAYTQAKTEKNIQTAEIYARSVHPLSIATFATSIFSYDQQILQTGIALQLLCIVYITINLFVRQHALHASYESTSFAVAALSMILVLSDPLFTTTGITIAMAHSLSLAYRYKKPEYTAVASTLLLILSVVIGQYFLTDSLSILEQLVFSSGALLIMLSSALITRRRLTNLTSLAHAEAAENVALIGIGIGLIAAMLSLKEDIIALYGVVWFVILLIYWAIFRRLHTEDSTKTLQQSNRWLVGAYSMLYIAQAAILLIQNSGVYSYDLSASLAGLIASILGALLTRAQWTRWASTGQWLLMPLVIVSTSTLGAKFDFTWMASLYSISAFFLMGSRLIALGRVKESFTKKTLTSLTGAESIAYSIGFYISIGIVAMYSIFSSYSSLRQALLLSLVTAVVVWYTAFVERYKASVIIPFAGQIIIGRLLWHTAPLIDGYTVSDARVALPLAASIVGVSIYVYFYSLELAKELSQSLQLQLATILMYVSPLYLFVFVRHEWSMAAGLMVAGAVTMHYFLKQSLVHKEFAGAVITAGLMWAIAIFGGTNIILHTHIIAALLAVYAFIRYAYDDLATSSNYSLSSVMVLAGPLTLAALSQEGIYSLLLLIEMSGLFILGLYVGRKHIYRTGLYTAVGALAYQLRSYGYAVVALIAIVVIGFAIHSALTQNDPDQKA